MSALPPPLPPAPPAPPAPPVPGPRPGGAGITFAIMSTLAGTVVFAFAWLIAKWFVNTCPEQGVTSEDADFGVARLILLVATLAWAAIPMLGARYARRRGMAHQGFVFTAGMILLLGAVAITTLSSGELCLS